MAKPGNPTLEHQHFFRPTARQIDIILYFCRVDQSRQHKHTFILSGKGCWGKGVRVQFEELMERHLRGIYQGDAGTVSSPNLPLWRMERSGDHVHLTVRA